MSRFDTTRSENRALTPKSVAGFVPLKTGTRHPIIESRKNGQLLPRKGTVMKMKLFFSLGLLAAGLGFVATGNAQDSQLGSSFFQASANKSPASFSIQDGTPAALPYEQGSASATGSFNVGNTGCDSCDGSGSGDCGCNRLGNRLSLPIIMRSEGGFDCFISPISNPVYFEDPRLMTEARGIFLQHKVPSTAGGGDIQLYALQLRARLSENVAFIATKDGYIASSNPLVGDGWADTAAGLKFALLRDPSRQRLTSAGFTFELASGEASALQGNGSGNLNLFLSNGRRIADSINWVSTSGIRMPFDTVDESSVVYASHHLSTNIGPRTWILTEFNVQNWIGAGEGGIPGVEGGDLFNFGSTGVAGNTIVTQAVGLKFRPRRNSELGAAFEFPLTERRDVIDNRINVNWILRY